MLSAVHLRALFRQPVRLLTGALGVTISMLIIILLGAISQGVYTAAVQFPTQTPVDLYVAQDGTPRLQTSSFLPAQLAGPIKGASGVSEVHPLIMNLTVLDLQGNKAPVYIVGYETDSGLGGPWKLTEGEQVRRPGEVVVDRSLAKQYGMTVGATVEILGRRFQVAGLSGDSRSMLGATMFMSLSDAQSLMGMQQAVNFFMVRLQPQSDAGAVRTAIEASLPPGVKVAFLDRQTAISQTEDLVDGVIGAPLKAATGVAYLVGIVLVGLLRYNNVMGRLTELAALRAVGATVRQIILSDLLVETGIVLTLGLGAGLLFGYVGGLLIAALIPQMQATINQSLLLQALGSTLFIGLLGSIWPVRKLRGIEPASAFR